jgi:hypothetical protein
MGVFPQPFLKTIEPSVQSFIAQVQERKAELATKRESNSPTKLAAAVQGSGGGLGFPQQRRSLAPFEADLPE